MKLFDSHCHLQDDALFPSVESVIDWAQLSGVERIVCCGTRHDDWENVIGLSGRFTPILPMIGIHPWFVSKNWSGSFQTLETMLRKYPEAGIGETGLDFSSFAKVQADRQERFTNRVEQEECFAAHLDLARELNRPVAVHCVHAWGRLMEILREHPAPRILLHAFSGAPELIPELVELNCRFSFCGSVTYPNAKRARASAAAVPADRLLIETDSPDFAPAGCKLPNEPANLVHVARAVAELRGISPESLAELTSVNAGYFFASV